MSKRFTKIICLMFAVVVAVGAALIAGCSDVYKADPLSKSKGEIFTDDEVVSNGGFAVEKGNYVYFINGKQSNTADNEYGTPVKGAIYRIATSDLKARNYSSVDCVVPLVSYSGNSDAGIFIYGDYIYYSTPSTGKTSSGAVENSKLDLKRTKLDGTGTMKDAFIQFDDNDTEFRFVEVEGTVYIMYVATDETLYDEDDGVTNLHSYNTKTGKNTLLAYDVGAVQFDDKDKTNPRVYYTMNVYNYSADENFGYNQVYSVTADATTDPYEDFDFTTIVGWDEDEDRYVNYGELIFDGIGLTDYLGNQQSGTPFNYDPVGDIKNVLNYNYTLRAYVNDTLFYTRTAGSDDKYNKLFSFSEKSYMISSVWNAVDNNAQEGMEGEQRNDIILMDGSSASKYEFIFDSTDKLASVLVTNDNGIAINKVVYDEEHPENAGKLQTEVGTDEYFYVAEGSSAEILFTEGKYLYYSVSEDNNNGYTINRVDYTGERSNYDTMSLVETEFTSVRVLDLDACSDWYLPELIEGQLMFASETDEMSSYNYIMVCDLHGEDGVMTNAEIRELNEKYERINEIFKDLSNTDDYPASDFANMVDALKYAHYTGEEWNVYLKGLAAACNAELEEEDDRIYSDKTKAMYDDFIAADGVWEEYKDDTATVNGKEVYANRRDYYYSVIGKMSGSDAKDYAEALKSDYLKDYPETETTWWEGLNTVSKVFFIIGMCAIGILLIGGGVVLTLVLIKRKNKKLPEFRKKKIKVDTTDDKDIDVYSDENAEKTEDKKEE